MFEDDALIPDPEVWRKFGVTPMTGWRWTHDPKLNFPQPIKLGTTKNSRNYRKGRELNEYVVQREIAARLAAAKAADTEREQPRAA